MGKALSLRAYARHRQAAGLVGGTLHAVQEAVAAGRVKTTKDCKIADARVADVEWEASTYADRVPLSGPAATKRGRQRKAAEGDDETPSLGEARARLDAAKASLAELDLAERRGELLQAQDVEARIVAVFSQCKTKLLGVPSRARQQDPGLTVAQLALLEALIREALEDLASEAGGEA